LPGACTYNYRLFDRYARSIASLAVLADEDAGWRPDHYGFEVLGCRHTLEFSIVKLVDYADRTKALAANPSPFALVAVAHLRTRQTKHDPQTRYRAKLDLVRSLYRQGWDRQRILDLFGVLDWMMRLPDALEQRLWQTIEAIEGETKMSYVTSVERLAIQKGMQQGLEQGRLEGKIEGLERLLVKRFGPLDEATRKHLDTATLEQLDCWTDRILDVSRVEAVFEEH